MPHKCQRNQHCVYECKQGYVRSSAGYSHEECPPGSGGGCKDVYYQHTSRHGLQCDAQGQIILPSVTPLCVPVDSYIRITSSLSKPVTGCPTVYPGSEDIRNTPYTVPAQGKLDLTLFPADYWQGVSRHFYVGLPGMSPQETCQWTSLPRTAYIWGGHLEQKNNQTWIAANFDFSEEFRATSGNPRYAMIVRKCSERTGKCLKYCYIQRSVKDGVVSNYVAKFQPDGETLASESTGAHSECYVYGPVASNRVELELVPMP